MIPPTFCCCLSILHSCLLSHYPFLCDPLSPLPVLLFFSLHPPRLAHIVILYLSTMSTHNLSFISFFLRTRLPQLSLPPSFPMPPLTPSPPLPPYVTQTYNGTRCVNATTDGDVIGCRAGFEDPKGSATIEGDKAFSSSIQLQPQHFSLQLRPGKVA